jgi:nickel transport protein
VRLQSPDGSKTLKLGHTGSDGSFKAKMPAQANREWELVVDGGPGHRDYLELGRSILGVSALGSFALIGLIRHGKRQRCP